MNLTKMRWTARFCTLAVMMVFMGSAWAQTTIDNALDATPKMTMDAIEAAYTSEDFMLARAGLLDHAEAGDRLAQFRLGYMMANAMGGNFDRLGAIQWLEAAISSGFGNGALLLAHVYLSGQPEESDFARAAILLAAEVKNDTAEANALLGGLYRQGRGVERDPDHAFELLRKAAGANLPAAQFAVSQMYARGEGVAQDNAQAARWLLQAADGGYPKAQMSLYFNYARGSGFPQDDEKAHEWLTKAMDGGDILATRIMGAALLTGDGVSADPLRGIALLAKAAEAGEAGAQSTLGYAYATGTGVLQNDAQAAVWYQKAADQGLTRAADVMGDFYLNGRGVLVDLTRAENYYRIALSGGSRHSAARLGQLMALGEIDPDAELELAYELIPVAAENADEIALDWVKTRAETGEPYLFYRLGVIYGDGLGVEADPDLAVVFLTKAAEGDVMLAQERLSALFAIGVGADQDYVRAHKWANIAAANGSDIAASQRDALADLMTPNQVAEAQRHARDFMARP